MHKYWESVHKNERIQRQRMNSSKYLNYIVHLIIFGTERQTLSLVSLIILFLFLLYHFCLLTTEHSHYMSKMYSLFTQIAHFLHTFIFHCLSHFCGFQKEFNACVNCSHTINLKLAKKRFQINIISYFSFSSSFIAFDLIFRLLLLLHRPEEKVKTK